MIRFLTLNFGELFNSLILITQLVCHFLGKLNLRPLNTDNSSSQQALFAVKQRKIASKTDSLDNNFHKFGRSEFRSKLRHHHKCSCCVSRVVVVVVSENNDDEIKLKQACQRQQFGKLKAKAMLCWGDQPFWGPKQYLVVGSFRLLLWQIKQPPS